jgi:hypothetical protein
MPIVPLPDIIVREWDNRIPQERDPWDRLEPRNPRDPIYIPREPIYRPEVNPRDPHYLPPRDRRDPIYRPSLRDDYWDDEWDFRRPAPRDRHDRDFDRIYYPPTRRNGAQTDDDWDLRRDPLEAEFFPSPRDDFRDPNFRMPNFDEQPPVRSPRS